MKKPTKKHSDFVKTQPLPVFKPKEDRTSLDYYGEDHDLVDWLKWESWATLKVECKFRNDQHPRPHEDGELEQHFLAPTRKDCIDKAKAAGWVFHEGRQRGFTTCPMCDRSGVNREVLITKGYKLRDQVFDLWVNDRDHWSLIDNDGNEADLQRLLVSEVEDLKSHIIEKRTAK